jgi:hypothetical protein
MPETGDITHANIGLPMGVCIDSVEQAQQIINQISQVTGDSILNLQQQINNIVVGEGSVEVWYCEDGPQSDLSPDDYIAIAPSDEYPAPDEFLWLSYSGGGTHINTLAGAGGVVTINETGWYLINYGANLQTINTTVFIGSVRGEVYQDTGGGLASVPNAYCATHFGSVESPSGLLDIQCSLSREFLHYVVAGTELRFIASSFGGSLQDDWHIEGSWIRVMPCNPNSAAP